MPASARGGTPHQHTFAPLPLPVVPGIARNLPDGEPPGPAVFHPFGNQATSARRPMALRPDLAIGLPFRGWEAAGPCAGSARGSRQLSNRVRRNQETRAAHRRRQTNSGHYGGRSRRIDLCTIETYVRFFPCQIVSLRENRAITQEVRTLAKPPPRQPLHPFPPPLWSSGGRKTSR